METKFTKGEWKTTIAELKDFFLCAVGSIETKRVICHTNIDYKMTSEECKANAKLIAAAPDLLDSCIELFEYYKSECLIPNLVVLKKAQQAIKKATE